MCDHINNVPIEAVEVVSALLDKPVDPADKPVELLVALTLLEEAGTKLEYK